MFKTKWIPAHAGMTIPMVAGWEQDYRNEFFLAGFLAGAKKGLYFLWTGHGQPAKRVQKEKVKIFSPPLPGRRPGQLTKK